MNSSISEIKTKVYDSCNFVISKFEIEQESKEYNACKFVLNGLNIIGRDSKITPKKAGQFVTFWKRKGKGPIEPFFETDEFDFFIVNVQSDNKLGQFVFSKSILIKKGIVSTKEREGKRAFRVYSKWDSPTSKQAERTQKWQLNYFYEINDSMNIKEVKKLYDTE